MSACFTPGLLSCAEVTADKIDATQSKVRVQAYWQRAHPSRDRGSQAPGLDVAAILDKTQEWRVNPNDRYS